MFSELDQPNKLFAVSLSLLTMSKQIQPPKDKCEIIDLVDSTDDEEQEASGGARAPHQKTTGKGDLEDLEDLEEERQNLLTMIRNTKPEALGDFVAPDQKINRKGDLQEEIKLLWAVNLSHKPSPMAMAVGGPDDNKRGQKHPVEESAEDSKLPAKKKLREGLWQDPTITKPTITNLLESKSLPLDYKTFEGTPAAGHPEGTNLLDVSHFVIKRCMDAMEEQDPKVVKCLQINADEGIQLKASRNDFKSKFSANLLIWGMLGNTIHDCSAHTGESTYAFCTRTELFTPVRKQWFDEMVNILIEAVDPNLERETILNCNFHTNCSEWKTQFEKGCWSNARLIEMIDNKSNPGQLSHELVSGLYWPFVKLADNLMPNFAAFVDNPSVPRSSQLITNEEYNDWSGIKTKRVHSEDNFTLEHYRV